MRPMLVLDAPLVRTVGFGLLLAMLVACGEASCVGAGTGVRAPTASGVLEVDPAALLEGDEGADTPTEATIEAVVSTRAALLRTRAHAEGVVRREALDRDPGFFGTDDDPSWAGASVEDAAARLVEMTQAERRPGTLLIDVGVRHEDPELAARLCNALMEQAIEAELGSRLQPLMSRLEWLTTELDALEEERRREEDAAELLDTAGQPQARARTSLARTQARIDDVHAEITAVDLSRGSVRPALRVADRCAPVD